MNHRQRTAGALFAGLCVMTTAHAATSKIPMKAVTADGVGQSVGIVTASDTPNGVRFSPALRGLPPGDHGFHVHDNASCDPAPDPDKGGAPAPAMSAGGHYDPETSGKHEGPDGAGHKGDLPVLTVSANGRASGAVVAPHLKVADLRGRALMIHEGGDNYSDQPTKLGGGGGRIACGVIR